MSSSGLSCLAAYGAPESTRRGLALAVPPRGRRMGIMTSDVLPPAEAAA